MNKNIEFKNIRDSLSTENTGWQGKA